MKDLFQAVETVISILHNRQELITYDKLKTNIEKKMETQFFQEHLGQIAAVFPMAYIFKLDKRKCDATSICNSYQLTVAPNMNYRNEKTSINLMDKFEPSSKGNKTSNSTFEKMTPVVVRERKNIFHKCLVERVKDQHNQFLKSLAPPTLNSHTYIKGWHPEFKLENAIDIVAKSLPKPEEEEKFTTAVNVLEKAMDMKESVTAVASATIKLQLAPTPVAVPTNTALNGISQNMIEKVRAREAAAISRAMTQNNSGNKELEMRSQISDINSIIHTVFVTEKKNILPWEFVISKISATYSGLLSTKYVNTYLNMLIKEVPEWATTICLVQKGTYLKIIRDKDLSEINAKLLDNMKSHESYRNQIMWKKYD